MSYLGLGATAPGTTLDFGSVATMQRNATIRTFGAKGHSAVFRDAGDNIPFTPARLAWNYGGYWLSDVAPRASALAANRGGMFGNQWSSDLQKFKNTMGAIFGAHVSLTDPGVLQAFLGTMLPQADAEKFWIAVAKLAAGVDSLGLLASNSDMKVDSVREAGQDLWNKVGKPTLGVAANLITAAKWLGIGLIAYVGYDAMTKGGRGS